VRELMDVSNGAREKRRAYTTYMTIMARLHTKGLLSRRREGKTDYYTPVYDRDDYMNLRAQAEVEGLVSEYGDVALSHFAQQMSSLDPARRRALQRLARKS
jgi:predicted transcriptional regulator